ncbi:hypothetical protein KP509_29G060500 [Ceratopteris richardii]|uniref:polynucleotide adenylyltransferase n=1 Tax=Ceratopteris richardii TaxID=49495 RepID=A0A8T2R968_CERRI|nr:hypothetical protein KP509_29G060500 [Ceratopteris richardii]
MAESHVDVANGVVSYIYDPSAVALTAAEEVFPAPLVLRRIIHDDCNGLFQSSSTSEKEVDFLSLSIRTEEEEEEEEDEEETKGITGVPETPQRSTSVASSAPLRSTSKDPPWFDKRGLSYKIRRSPLLDLHQEIISFCDLVSPTKEDEELRTAAVQRVSDVIKSIWTKCQVTVFGSFATGLYLPASDIDVVILDSGCCDIQLGLKALAKAFARRGIAKNVQIIGKAKVPIIKFVEIGSSISFDISFDMENGPEAAQFIKDALTAIPPLRPLCLVLKTFLQQRELNEVYTGGIGSYALLVMLLAYLQTRTSKSIHAFQRERITLEPNLGVLLVDFFEFYGRSLNYKEVGISCRHGGHFFKKKERGFWDSRKPFMLTVEDPQAPENDIAKSSYNFQKVRLSFLLAHRQLTNHKGEDEDQSGLLAHVVRVDEKIACRKLPFTPTPQNRKKKQKKIKNKGANGEQSQKERRPRKRKTEESQAKRKRRKHDEKKWSPDPLEHLTRIWR